MNQKELEDLICTLYEIEEPTELIKSQISKFVEEHGYTYKDIGRAFYYFNQVLGREPRLAAGIGIVPYYIEDAREHFRKEKQRLDGLKRQGEVLKNSEPTKTIRVKEVKRDNRGIKKIDMTNITWKRWNNVQSIIWQKYSYDGNIRVD